MSPRVEHLESVDGIIVYDVPGAAASGGGTRLAVDVTRAEVELLARAMTYKLAVLRLPVGGAKVGLRARPQDRDRVIGLYRREIASRLAAGELMTGPDLGTTEEDFVGLPIPGGRDGVAATTIDGLPAEEVLTGIGVASALDTALDGGLDGRDVALEGFGKMGASIARALELRGGRVVAVSTIAGCVVARPGTRLDVGELVVARDAWGDGFVSHLGLPVHDRGALWAVACDALVPGARPGSLDERVAQRVTARVVVPVANAPYTAGGLATLVGRGIAAHADFVASGGGAMAYLSPAVASAGDAQAASAAVDDVMGAIVGEACESPGGPYAGAAAMAERFLRTWATECGWQAGPPLVY